MPLIESTIAVLLFWAVAGYLLGSIPFGILVTRTLGLGDLRAIGSGNIGTTNVLRTGSKKAAAATLALDAAKGAVVVLVARAYAAEDAAQVAAFAAMVGHCYPIWLRFAGGKGVATFLGLMIALSWPVGLACCLAWLAAVLLTRISSVGAIAAASASTPLMVFIGDGSALLLGVLLTCLIFWRHRENYRRLKAGTEPRIGEKS